MINIFGPTATSGRFNVMGTDDGSFVLQGNLSLAEIVELRDECNRVLEAQEVGNESR